MEERTVLVPTTVMEHQTITVTKCRPETRQETFTEYHNVPETQTVQRQYTEMVSETQM
jgi:hypothetical protein